MQDQILGDYKILRQIGQGSLGTVWLAEHRFIKKHYILKVLPEELAQNRDFIQRFEDEVSRIATLDHPHLVKVHTVSYASGVYFLVTDCVLDSLGETTNLAQYMSVRKERLREEELLRVLKQIADALDYAHNKEGMIHLNLKLSNILIGKSRPGIEVLLSDFGLSKVVGMGPVITRCIKAYGESLGLTTQEQSDEKYTSYPFEANKLSKLNLSFLQSFAFLAPEQKRMQRVEWEADIYAFGVLTFYLITGSFPEGVLSLPIAFPPEYTYRWDDLITQCLQFSPDKRPKKLLPLLEEITSGRKETTSIKNEWEQPVMRTLPQEKTREQPEIEKISSMPKFFAAHPVEKVQVRELQKNEEEEALAVAAPVARSFVQVTEVKTAQSFAFPTLNPSTPTKYENIHTGSVLGNERDPIVKQYQPEKKEVRQIEPLLTEMILIQGGRFLRGSKDGNRDETPQHMITTPSFAIDIHPVTNEQFVRFLEYMGGEKDHNYNDLIRLKDSRLNRTAGRLSIESGYSKHPVVGVTWYGAVAYAKWIGKRLPSEAEWEIAARGGFENHIYPTGESIEKVHANFFSSDTTAVMSYHPNGYGLYDVAGNVYEWCQDWYGYNYYETSLLEPNNPKGPVQGVYRVLRGGCWKSLKDDLRCSHRHRNNPGAVNGTYGFRCAADV